MKVSPKQFYGRSNWRGVVVLVGDYLWIAAVVALAHVFPSPWLYPLWLALISVKMFALGESLLHEASHHTLFAHKKANDWVAPLVAWPFLYTMNGYRAEHRAHHRLLGQNIDPLWEQYVKYGLRSADSTLPDPPLGTGRALWIYAGRPLLGLAPFYILPDSLKTLKGDREAWGVLAWWTLVPAAFAAFGALHLFVLYWAIPMVFGFTAWLYWSEITDHYNIPVGDTRTVTSPLTNWLTHNNGIHALHHKYAGIPWFKLPEAYEAMKGSFPETVSTGWFDTLVQLTTRYEHEERAAS